MTITMDRALNLRLVEPLPGFAEDERYTLTAIDAQGVLFSLRSVRHPELRFVLTPAGAFFADYQPDVVNAVAGVLGSDDVDVLLMITLGAGLRDATANLRAPIAVAASTGRAVQVVLDDETLPMREPLARYGRWR